MLQRFLAARCRANLCFLATRGRLISSHTIKISYNECGKTYQRLGTIIPTLKPIVRLNHNGSTPSKGPLNEVLYEQVCDTTLDSLCEYFEEAVEQCSHLVDTDVTLGDGVLTLQFGSPYGTYVINRQRPNQQIWLSSPTSGPKRYDFVNGQWIYKHDGMSLHELLEKEISIIVKKQIDLSKCAFAKPL